MSSGCKSVVKWRPPFSAGKTFFLASEINDQLKKQTLSSREIHPSTIEASFWHLLSLSLSLSLLLAPKSSSFSRLWNSVGAFVPFSISLSFFLLKGKTVGQKPSSGEDLLVPGIESCLNEIKCRRSKVHSARSQWWNISLYPPEKMS